MPVMVKKMGDKWRLVDKSGNIEKNKKGTPLDGGGHDSKEGAIKQMQAININKADAEIVIPPAEMTAPPIVIIYNGEKFQLFIDGKIVDFTDLSLSSYTYSDGYNDACLSFSFQKDVGGGLIETKTYRLKPKV